MYREILAKLVSFESVSCTSNLPLIKYLKGLFSDVAKVDCIYFPEDENKANLLVTLGPCRDDGKGLVLASHLDVVPAGDGWDFPPFQLVERDNKFFGRGTADMKGFAALAIEVALSFKSKNLVNPLVLLFTHDEEIGAVGAKVLYDNSGFSFPKNVIVGEPTKLIPVTAHKGHLRVKITFLGKRAHSAYKHLGENAIVHASRFVTTLYDNLEAIENLCSDSDSIYYNNSVNVGMISGGEAVNIVPDRCVLDIGIRISPSEETSLVDFKGEFVDPLTVRILRILERMLEEICGDRWILEITSYVPPFYNARPGILGDVLGSSTYVNYTTDASWLSRMGLNVVVWGPGSIEVAHKANEFIEFSQISKAREKLIQVVKILCEE